MAHEDKKILAVFFTHGVSLELWEQRGLFSREVRFYQELAHRVGEVWFFTYGANEEKYQERLGPHIRIFPKRLPIPNLLYGFLLPILCRVQIKQTDVIRIHQMAGAIPALIAHWLLRKPLMVRCGYQWSAFLKRQRASRIKQWIVSLIERVTYRAATTIIVATHTDAESIHQRYRILPQKIHVIPNGIDTDLFKPFPVEKQAMSICFVGRLEPQKNLMNLLEALRGVDAHLLLYGEGSLRKDLEQRARELEINVDFRGKIENDTLPAALNACKIFVLPSFYEGNPKVLLEAMACGLPVIGTNVEGIREIIQHNQNGILCDPTTEALRKTIQQLISDQETRQRLGLSARQSILEACSLPSVMRKEYEICASLFHETPPQAS